MDFATAFRRILPLIVLAPASQAGHAQQSPALASCNIPGLTGEVRCGTVEVLEDRSNPSSRRLSIFVVVASATGPSRQADPFLLFAGGPGQAASRMGDFATTAFDGVRRERDIVLVDARGTGRSHGLSCAMMRNASDVVGASMYPASSVRFCRDSLARHADLRQYTTAAIADDIEAVRAAFGWPAINIYGTSYGTRLALIYLRRHPRSVRSMVLKAVAPPTLIAPMNYAEDSDRAFDLLARDCRNEPSCAAAYPDPRSDLNAVISLASRGLVKASIGGDSLALTRDAVVGTLMSAMQSASARAQLPAMLHAAARGGHAAVAGQVVQLRRILDRELFIGMHLSVACGEDGRRLDVAASDQRDARTFLGSARVRMLADACRDWIVPPETPGAHDAVRSDVPVLLVSGELDPNTPARHAESAAGTLSRSRHVLLRGVSHGWSNVIACGSGFVADFVRRATVDGLDVSCADQSSAPPFVIR